MPHLVVEYSDIFAPQHVEALRDALHEIVASTDTIQPEAVKSRLLPYRYYQAGTKQTTTFVHVQLSVLAGREKALLQTLGKKLFDTLGHLVSTNEDAFPECKLSLEVREMNADLYFK